MRTLYEYNGKTECTQERLKEMVGQNDGHFAAEDWPDFMNGTQSTDVRHIMQRHLGSRCIACGEAADAWQEMRHMAQLEREYPVPGWALKHIQSAFVMTRRFATSRSFAIPRLVFDSLSQPAPAGVRNSAGWARQMIYRGRGILVEMQLERMLNSERVNIAGQLSSMSVAGEKLPDVPVMVDSPWGKLAEASTNQFGEFAMDFVPEENLRISFAIRRGQELSIPLEITPGGMSAAKSSHTPWTPTRRG